MTASQNGPLLTFVIVHSKVKRSSLHSQCWLRLFLWFPDILIWSSIFTTVFMLGWWNFALTDLLVCVFSWQTKHPNKPRRHGFLKWKEEVKALLALLLHVCWMHLFEWFSNAMGRGRHLSRQRKSGICWFIWVLGVTMSRRSISSTSTFALSAYVTTIT